MWLPYFRDGPEVHGGSLHEPGRRQAAQQAVTDSAADGAALHQRCYWYEIAATVETAAGSSLLPLSTIKV